MFTILIYSQLGTDFATTRHVVILKFSRSNQHYHFHQYLFCHLSQQPPTPITVSQPHGFLKCLLFPAPRLTLTKSNGAKWFNDHAFLNSSNLSLLLPPHFSAATFMIIGNYVYFYRKRRSVHFCSSNDNEHLENLRFLHGCLGTQCCAKNTIPCSIQQHCHN